MSHAYSKEDLEDAFYSGVNWALFNKRQPIAECFRMTMEAIDKEHTDTVRIVGRYRERNGERVFIKHIEGANDVNE